MKVLYHTNSNEYDLFWNNVAKIFEFSFCFDRTNTIDFGFEYCTHSPIPSLSNYPSFSFNQAADLRGNQIMRKENVLLFLSGGIDSTVIFSSLLKTNKPFTVTYSTESLREYPDLYSRINNNEWPQVSTANLQDLTPDMISNFHTVNGGIGDQVTLPVTALNLDGTGFKDCLTKPYQEVMPNYLIKKLEEQISKSQTNIKDFADFLWWIDFTLKHQGTLMSEALNTGADVLDPNSYSSFFDCPEIDVWSMLSRDENKECVYANDISLHKRPLKQYILDVLDDRDYFENKVKEPSRVRHIDRFNRNQIFSIVVDNNQRQIIYPQ